MHGWDRAGGSTRQAVALLPDTTAGYLSRFRQLLKPGIWANNPTASVESNPLCLLCNRKGHLHQNSLCCVLPTENEAKDRLSLS